MQRASFNNRRYIASLLLIGIIWGIAYSFIIPASQYITYQVLAISSGSPLGSAVEFFLYDTAKILLLLLMMIYVIAWLRASIQVDKVRHFLLGKKRLLGYGLGAFFGAVTPFCSCSSIPLFLGFTSARIPLGITMAFLITSPLINEVAVVVLWGILGFKFTTIYVVVGLLVGVIGGAIIDLLKAERWLQPFLLTHLATQDSPSLTNITTPQTLTLQNRHEFAWQETTEIFKRVWKWVLIGVAIGAALHGYVPQTWITDSLGDGQWWSVPLSVLLGIPLYTNVTGIIPVMESLLTKGLPMGTTLAFCMSTVAISLPEIMMLKQVMRWQLLVIFITMMLVIFTLVGWLFNVISL